MSDDTRRILFAGFFHETHTFVTDMTPLADFKFCRGADQLARAGDGSTIDGFLEVAARENWDLVPTLDATALPSGTIDHAVFEAFWDELAPALAAAAGTIDGIWLALHGAAVTSRCDDVEGELLERLRRIPGLATLPVFGVFDLHATFTERMATHANGLVGYRENPHTDARAAAVLSVTTGQASALVGVMVAVALLPPAATLGFMVGAGHLGLAFGAGTLLAVNVVCVNITAQLVLVLRGVTPRSWREKQGAQRSVTVNFAVWAFLLVALIALIVVRTYF